MTTLSDVTTPPSTGLNHLDVLFDRGPGWNWLTPARNVIRYTFALNPGNLEDAGDVNGAASAFNAAQQSATVTALNYITQITGITFESTSNGSAADLHFSAIDIAGPDTSGLCSWQTSYSRSGNTIVSYSASAWLYLDNVQFAGENNNPAPGTGGYETLLHELGHALGLKHPFDGSVTLPDAKDNTDYTLMSYTHVGSPRSSYGPYDIAALMWLYGGDGLGGLLGQGAPGQYLVGSELADTLTGGSGDDVFEGEAGNDTVNGGAGTDTARFAGTRAQYTITPTQAGFQVSGPDGIDTLVGVEKAHFNDQTVTLAGAGNSPPTGSITIGAGPRQGVVLTATSTLVDADGLGTLAWRWQSSVDGNTWIDVPGIATNTLTPSESQVGLKLRALASYVDGLGKTESATSAASAAVINVNDAPSGSVTLTGTAKQGEVLHVANTLADADGLGLISLRWQTSADGNSWADLTNAGGTQFTLTEAQVGLRLRVRASWTDGHGSAESVPSAASAAVANVNDGPTGSVTLSGLAEQGQLLKAANTLADVDGLGTIAYEWQMSPSGNTWSAIAGANGSSFTPGIGQAGQLLRVLARYTDGHGTVESAASPASAAVLGRQTGSAAADTLSGSAYIDRLDGLDGNDRLTGGGGADQINGGGGIDTAVYFRARADYTVSAGAGSVKALAGDEGIDALNSVERLQFADQSLAFDLNAAAGSTARILGAVFGRDAVANKAYAGIGLGLLDTGTSNDALMQMALEARLGSGFSAEAEVDLLFRNLVGQAPDAGTLNFWVGELQAGHFNPVSLAWMAADLDLNAQNIGLTGLAAQGLGYTS